MKNKLTLLVVMVATAGLFSSCWEKASPKSFVRPVKLTEVKSLQSYDKDFVGVVSAEQYTDLAFRVGGLIQKTYINEGSYVKKGQVLAEVDPADNRLQMDADKAQYQSTKSILERTERLLAKQAISVQEMEISKANFQKAKSQYEYSKNQLSYTRLTAPFSGSIEKKYVENYQKVNPGQAIYKLINPDVLDVKFTLPENDVSMTGLNNAFYIEFDNFRGELFKAKIKEVVDASVDGAGIPVTLSITDAAFKPEKYNIKAGFACRIKVIIDNPAMLSAYVTVPITAVFENDTKSASYVWVYDATTSTVNRHAVTTKGLHGSDGVIISEGVKEGEMVVTAGVYQIVDGQKVSLLQ